MSTVFQFGVTHNRQLTSGVARRLDRICREHGGSGFVGPVSIPGNAARGWFESENIGEPFNSATAREVLEAVKAEGINL